MPNCENISKTNQKLLNTCEDNAIIEKPENTTRILAEQIALEFFDNPNCRVIVLVQAVSEDDRAKGYSAWSKEEMIKKIKRCLDYHEVYVSKPISKRPISVGDWVSVMGSEDKYVVTDIDDQTASVMGFSQRINLENLER